jgi:hypothetical protein
MCCMPLPGVSAAGAGPLTCPPVACPPACATAACTPPAYLQGTCAGMPPRDRVARVVPGPTSSCCTCLRGRGGAGELQLLWVSASPGGCPRGRTCVTPGARSSCFCRAVVHAPTTAAAGVEAKIRWCVWAMVHPAAAGAHRTTECHSMFSRQCGQGGPRRHLAVTSWLPLLCLESKLYVACQHN